MSSTALGLSGPTFSGKRESSPRKQSDRCLKFNTHVQNVPSFRISGAVLLLRLYNLMIWTAKSMPFSQYKLSVRGNTGLYTLWRFKLYSPLGKVPFLLALNRQVSFFPQRWSFLRAFAKLRKVTISFVMSVCPSA
jgi:hypothetical protein